MISAQTALANLALVREDLRMLKDGEWVPDEDSCECSIEVIGKVIDFLHQFANSKNQSAL